MTKSEFYKLVPDYVPTARLATGGEPLSPAKQRWVNQATAELRVLRDVYSHDPLIKEVVTNVLADLILIDKE